MNQDVFEDNMKRNSDLWNTWSSCVMQMLKRQTRVKGAVKLLTVLIKCFFAMFISLMKYVSLIQERPAIPRLELTRR